MRKWLIAARHPLLWWQLFRVVYRHNKEVYRRGNMTWKWWHPTGSKVSDDHILWEMRRAEKERKASDG